MSNLKGRAAREFSPLMHEVVTVFLRHDSIVRTRTDKERAEKIGMTYATYRRLVRDKHHLDIDELTRIARFMGISPGELIDRATKRVADAQV